MSSEIDKQFREITEPYELNIFGVIDYEVVASELVQVHQVQLERHIEAIAGDQSDLSSLPPETIRELNRRVWGDFVMFDVFDVDDVIVGCNGGAVLMIDGQSGAKSMSLTNTFRIHGRVVRPVILSAPRLEPPRTGADKYRFNPAAETDQAAVALELGEVSVEENDKFTSLPAGVVAYLPLCYQQMQIKKRNSW